MYCDGTILILHFEFLERFARVFNQMAVRPVIQIALGGFACPIGQCFDGLDDCFVDFLFYVRALTLVFALTVFLAGARVGTIFSVRIGCFKIIAANRALLNHVVHLRRATAFFAERA